MSAFNDIVIDHVRLIPVGKRTLESLTELLIPVIGLFPEAERTSIMDEFSEALKAAGLIASASQICLATDPFLVGLEGLKQWGDIEYGKASATPVIIASEVDDDWSWNMPVLGLRKDIWENFPVAVVPMGTDRDGAERHAIVWHRKNLAEWREERATDFDEWMNYDDIQERRLFKALEASNKWTVEPAVSNEICVLRMKFNATPSDDVVEPKVINCGAGMVVGEWTTVKKTGIPTLILLNDIKTHFPAVWKQIPGTRINAIELHCRQMRDMGLDRATTAENLLRALRASPSWRVLRSEGPNEICRIELS